MTRLHACLACLALVAACSDSSSPPPPWTRVVATPQSDSAYAVATDSGGNVILAGSTLGSLGGVAAAGGLDLFVAKLDAAGATLWTRQLGTSLLDEAMAVATDAAGNVLVAGITDGGLDGNASLGNSDAVLLKFDSAGTKAWSRQFGTADEDYAYGVATDADGNAFVVGVTRGPYDAGADDGFVVAFDPDGARLWTTALRTPRNEWARGVATDAAGYVYVVGYTDGSLDGNLSSGGHDLFVVKYDGAGQRKWTLQLGTSTSDLGYAIATDALGAVYAAGHTYGAFDGNPLLGGSDAFVVKLDAAGTPQWSAQLGSSTADFAEALATDAGGNVYVAGYTLGALEGSSSGGAHDAFVAKLDAAGAKQWIRQFGTAAYDYARGVATDAEGHVFVAGYSDGPIDGIPSAGGWDAYVTSLDAAGNRR